MRTSILTRAGAILTASALAFSLNTGAASATEVSGGKVLEPVNSAAVITGFSMSSGVITTAAVNFFPGNVPVTGITTPTLTAQTEVRVNGVYRGLAQLGPNGASIPRSFGSGSVQLGPTHFSDGTVDGARSNTFYARKQVKTLRRDGYALNIKRRNSRMTFSARQIKVVNPATGSYSRIKSVKLQQLKNGKWKTKKTIKLNSRGNGSYKTSIKTKYRYRLYIPRSTRQERFETIKTRKI